MDYDGLDVVHGLHARAVGLNVERARAPVGGGHGALRLRALVRRALVVRLLSVARLRLRRVSLLLVGLLLFGLLLLRLLLFCLRLLWLLAGLRERGRGGRGEEEGEDD